MPKVVILGGGPAGLSAAHELLERGFEVAVYDKHQIDGGKARSYPMPNTAAGGRRDLPGEHGFRFFAGFYRHLPDTLKRIPFGQNKNGVYDNLVTASRLMIARAGEKALIAPTHFPESIGELASTLRSQVAFINIGIPPSDLIYFAERLLVLLSSCDERRENEFENQSWFDFIDAENRSELYRKYLATALTRNFVACRAASISARTGGLIGLQLLFDMVTPGLQLDRLLNGPTNEVWIRPWLEYLRRLGLDYYRSSAVQRIHCDPASKRITGVDIDISGVGIQRVTADYYVAAFPVEVMVQLATDEMKTVEPKLAGLGNLQLSRMNGIQYYLRRDVPIVHGHVTYIDSPWAVTSVSQAQFWRDSIPQSYGDGAVTGILSVDISDWSSPCECHGRKAEDCTKGQLIEDVWIQLKAHLNSDPANPVLRDENLHSAYLDRDVRERAPSQRSMATESATTFAQYNAAGSIGTALIAAGAVPRAMNIDLEPLLVNTAGSLQYRPHATIAIENLFLASDYVRTYTDLATMEGANEAARRAVNGILAAAGSNAMKCDVWPLTEPEAFRPLREWDKQLYRQGYAGPFASPPALFMASAAGDVANAANAAVRFLRALLDPFGSGS